MGKTKQAKEKKFDRNVEISAPILDPEIIKAIHSPPRGQRLDMKHGGFKALLSDLNSQDSTDEMSPLNENHVPSYIGISCAVSGYSNYSSYSKKPSASPILRSELGDRNNIDAGKQHSNRSRTTSPTAHRNHPTENHHVHHITIDKSNIKSPDEERKELTEKLIASATEQRRSPSPIPPTEDDRHHGTYVGARYCPLPPPSRIANQHIPLLGIDDDQNSDDFRAEDQVNKVEQKIANLYGDEFVEDWRESMTHKAKKELPEDQNEAEQQAVVKNPKDLVTLKPTPPQNKRVEEQIEDVPTPSAKVLAGVEKQFLNKLLTDENPPTPSPPPYLQSPVKETRAQLTTQHDSPTPIRSPIGAEPKNQDQQASPEPNATELARNSPSNAAIGASPTGEAAHIEYVIRSESPVANEASPVRIRSQPEPKAEPQHDVMVGENLVNFTPEPSLIEEPIKVEDKIEPTVEREHQHLSTESEINDGRYYLNLLDQEKSFILSQVVEAEAILSAQESELDEDTTGRIRSAIGKANLLVNKKCNQFKELCESNMNANADEQYATLNDDLAGFWDMIRIQFEDVRKSFENIWNAKANNWNSGESKAKDLGDDESRESNLRDKVCKPKLSAQKDQERRERLKEHINQMKQNQAATNNEGTALADEHLEAVADDLDQVGCDVIETVAPAETRLESISSGEANQQAEEQLFSLMGSTSPSPPPPLLASSGHDQSDDGEAGQQSSEKPSKDLLDLLD